MRRYALGCVLALFGLTTVGWSGEEKPVEPKKMVFAHYMTCLANGVEFGKQEIDLAQRHNIDGYALNSLAWGKWDEKKKEWIIGGHGRGAVDIYEAAKQLDSGFMLFNSADVNGNLSPLPRAMVDMVERFKDHPNQFKHNGKVVLSAWAGTPATFRSGCDLLKERGHEVCFVPFVVPGLYQMSRSFESMLMLFRDQPHMDGYFFFVCDGEVDDMMAINAIARRATVFEDKIYMAGIAPAYNSPNLRDMRGTEGYCAMWEGLIRDDADWVEIVTWNDYNEDSNLMPFRWRNGQERQYYSRDETFLDVTAYYAAWFKSGVQPKITQDKVYFTYRTRPHDLTKAYDAALEEWTDIARKPFPFDQIHDDVLDRVYVTGVLTAPATVEVELGGETTTLEFPAGIHHARVPLKPGVPQVRIARGGKKLAEVSGRKNIVGEPTPMNSPAGYHLLNRTWTNAVVVGASRTLNCAAGELTEGAGLVDVAGRKAVKPEAKEGSGAKIPVDGLETSTYNVRVTYTNPGEEEARLTLFADGPPRSERGYPYYIPLFMPPTGKGKVATTSFLWSLYDKTTYLQVAWEPGRSNRSKLSPLYDDHGEAAVVSLELVKVETAEVPEAVASTLPAMVAIPGGGFTMGTDEGDPDEAPPHEVTLSPFAIGKFEVTNEEYERYDPKHRRFRDGFSWRDREPVIYISWKQAMGYCNWLSERHGLKPAYVEKEVEELDERKWLRMRHGRKAELAKGRKPEELKPLEKPMRKAKRWVLDRAADGFRLPTEAEWEYVASGRGEGRTYPWGNEKPRPWVHGRFELEEALTIHRVRPAQEEAGVCVVGSFPAGASRDGVMDLAGNVAEWVSDWFQLYTDKAQQDPHAEEASHYRSIRGGSWGYYGLGQRVTDREYNNPNYGGYIYIGFRVALPEAGYKQLYGGI